MKLLKIPMFLVMLAAASSYASARPPSKKADAQAPPPPPPWFGMIDKDRDGVLSAVEIQAASEAILKLDADHNGEVTVEETHMPPPKEGDKPEPPDSKNHAMPPRPVPPMVKALDTNGDGSLSPEEMTQAPESLKILDKDQDGALSPEELRPEGPPPPSEE